jgi:hypothetical protein
MALDLSSLEMVALLETPTGFAFFNVCDKLCNRPEVYTTIPNRPLLRLLVNHFRSTASLLMTILVCVAAESVVVVCPETSFR